eukprot:CAMPEP_0119323060 /NCGR_PEP_ID=MMETSP1333-20130426/59857_1 /TAXON_ID=418940 /ORGANISM="Scyphosphaera apsteinii, Strain RCC1455" /LENGTH=909 /DNA_ID=CAMNT_0007330421 /DNA_START=43 /DNA_END=2772 /DNA_ORIENTATION=-
METPVRAKLGLAAAAAAGAIAAYVYYRYRSRLKTDGNMVLRSAYAPAPYLIETVDLNFILTEEQALVKSTLRFVCSGAACPLYLDGEDLALRSIALNGVPLVEGHDYVLGAEEGLTVLAPPASAFELSIVVAIKPQENTQLSGLYKTSGNYCTQCEAVGFRRITYFLDRPDILSKYTVRVEADKALYPVLLSNGNETGRGEMAGSRHWASFEDPFKKPCYLFALVAAKLEGIESSFTTCSGKQVRLAIWSEAENAGQLDWAMQSLKDAMAWDERVYGREYDLDVFHIVAVNDFNMGAMENKGLNVFNTACVLAKSSTATDADYERVQGVVAHEYFHNWTGNRVTCRDWFQLTLKEGLTVFRDQSFSADMTSEAVKRIEDVRVMRAHQFVEDAGPMAHPIRPESYLAIDNFYTVTVYEKGAEVIRLYQTLLGAAGFRKGMDLYFERHDGQAVTCDDFRAAMADANGRDLTQFERWYTQAGTPTVKAVGAYDSVKHIYTLTLSQSTPATPGQPRKLPFHIPIKMKLLDNKGSCVLAEQVLELTRQKQTFVFKSIRTVPVLSLLRGFSAPVRLDMPVSNATLELLAAHDDDAFNRWDASQQLASRVLLALVAEWQVSDRQSRIQLDLPDAFVATFRATLTAEGIEPSLKAYTLSLPEYSVLAQEMSPIDPDGLVAMLRLARRSLARRLRAEFTSVYVSLAPPKGETFTVAPEAVGQRRLRNVCLEYLSQIGDAESEAVCLSHFREATTMTDSLAALKALAPFPGAALEEVSDAFYSRAKANSEALVINKWFAVQASTFVPDALQRVQALMVHEAYDGSNPNRVRSVVNTFASANPAAFHARDGLGYEFIGLQVLELDKRNPQLAARLCNVFRDWKKYDEARQALMRAQLLRIRDTQGISKDVLEISSRSIDG